MLAGKRARLVEQLAEIQDSIDFVDAKQRFYDDVLSGATPYVSVLIPSAALAKESEEPGELKGVERKLVRPSRFFLRDTSVNNGLLYPRLANGTCP